MLFYYSQLLIFLLSKNGLNILQLLQNRVSIQKSTQYHIFCCQKLTQYFATCTKNRPDILLSKIDLIFLKLYKYRPDSLLSKINPIFLKLYKNWLNILLLKNRVSFLVENRPIKSMHNFETYGAPYRKGLMFSIGFQFLYDLGWSHICIWQVVSRVIFSQIGLF